MGFVKKKKTQMNICSFNVRSQTRYGLRFNPGYKILVLKGTQSQMKKKIGDFDCSYWINAIILNTKKCIFVSKVKEIKPTLSYIKSTVKNMHSYEKFSFQLKDKERAFLQRWGIYTEYIEN